MSNVITIQSEKLEQLIAELAARLRRSKGKKVYGYLSPQLKAIVDQIVDELAKDERVAAAYDLWQEMQDEVVRVYTDDLPERLPLSRRKEFKTVRNMVIREAVKFSEQQFTFEDEGMEDEPVDADEPSAAWEAIRRPELKQKRRSAYEQAERYREAKETLLDPEAGRALRLDAIGELERLWDEGCIVAAHQLGKAFRDGLGVKMDAGKAAEWFRRGAEAGNDYSEYALGKLWLERGDTAVGVACLARAAKRGNQYAQYRLGKLCLEGEAVPKDVDAALSHLGDAAAQGNQYAQYTLGKLYLLGREAPRDEELALHYLQRAAAQGNVYAQYYLDHMGDRQDGGSVGLVVLRMLHSMGRIFREETAKDGTFGGLHIDGKRRRELLEKRLAMGRKIDDHEDSENNVNHTGREGSLFVFEAPIDLMSFATMFPYGWQDHSYVACCGTSFQPVAWMLEQVKAGTVFLCLDNDKAGQEACERMEQELQSLGIGGERLVPKHKDWNEDLAALCEQHQEQEAAVPCQTMY